jgi:restriction system protein
MMDKKAELLKLAKQRQSEVYEGYKSIGDYDYASGAYECDYISPYSKSAHNIDTDVVLVLQDWSSDRNLKGEVCEETKKLGYSPCVETNKNLKKLLEIYLGLKLKDVYVTNLFPYIKKGDMSAYIPSKDMQKAAKEFTLPMISIIKPKIVVALGLRTFNALRQSCGLKKVYNMDEAVENPFEYQRIKINFQAHPAQRSQNSRGKLKVEEDWKSMAAILNNA